MTLRYFRSWMSYIALTLTDLKDKEEMIRRATFPYLSANLIEIIL